MCYSGLKLCPKSSLTLSKIILFFSHTFSFLTNNILLILRINNTAPFERILPLNAVTNCPLHKSAGRETLEFLAAKACRLLNNPNVALILQPGEE